MAAPKNGIVLTTPDDVKRASLLYEKLAVLEVDAPLGFRTANEDWRECRSWCVQRATIVPNDEHKHLDFRDDRVLATGGKILELATKWSAKYSNEYIATLLPGTSDLAADLEAIGTRRVGRTATAVPEHVIARVILEGVDPIAVERAEWAQIKEFREDTAASDDYRRILRLHRVLGRARSESEARDTLSVMLDDYRRALVTHGFESDPKAHGLQLAIPLNTVLLGYLDGSVGTLVTALAGLALVGYQLWADIQRTDQSELPALIVKAQGFADRARRGQEGHSS